MYETRIYVDAHGRAPIKDFCAFLRSGGGKNSRVQLSQIDRQVHLLAEVGTRGISGGAGKHIRGDIWELTPGDNRILFFFWKDKTYVLLHAFRKTTQATPLQEIAQAEREMQDWIARHGA